MPPPRKILVVDDEPVICRLFSRILTDKGYEVDRAANGLEAVKKAKEEDFDLVFLDIVMPKMDGLETCRALKALKPDLPIVIMTGYAVEEKIHEALRLGAIECVRKPFDIDAIVEVIKRAGAQRRQKAKGANA
jgi:CheY-like chemotaxis protein